MNEFACIMAHKLHMRDSQNLPDQTQMHSMHSDDKYLRCLRCAYKPECVRWKPM